MRKDICDMPTSATVKRRKREKNLKNVTRKYLLALAVRCCRIIGVIVGTHNQKVKLATSF